MKRAFTAAPSRAEYRKRTAAKAKSSVRSQEEEEEEDLWISSLQEHFEGEEQSKKVQASSSKAEQTEEETGTGTGQADFSPDNLYEWFADLLHWGRFNPKGSRKHYNVVFAILVMRVNIGPGGARLKSYTKQISEFGKRRQ